MNSRNSMRIHEELHKLLKEVRYFAAIKDPHIIRYNHSWIEVTFKKPLEEQPKTVIAADKNEPHEEKNTVVLLSPYVQFIGDSPENSSKTNSEIEANLSESAGSCEDLRRQRAGSQPIKGSAYEK